MKITWLGQAGLLFYNGETQIMVDPYLSNSVAKVDSANYRRQTVNEYYFDLIPDVMIFTHDHLDHYDPATASRFLDKTEKSMLILSPASVWGKARQHGNGHNYVLFDKGTEWTVRNLRFTAIPAVHSDHSAIGVLIEDLQEQKTYYITGDTLYSSRIFEFLPPHIDVVFLPINGVGNNMNQDDAVRFADAIGAGIIVPIHFGMFDEITPKSYNERYFIPQIYRDIPI